MNILMMVPRELSGFFPMYPHYSHKSLDICILNSKHNEMIPQAFLCMQLKLSYRHHEDRFDWISLADRNSGHVIVLMSREALLCGIILLRKGC